MVVEEEANVQLELLFNGQVINTSQANLEQLKQLFPIKTVVTITGDGVDEDVLKAFNEFLSTRGIKDLTVELAFKIRKKAHNAYYENLLSLCERIILVNMVLANCTVIAHLAYTYGDEHMITKCDERTKQLIRSV